MFTTRRLNYKGYEITARCSELPSIPTEVKKRFQASFSVDPLDAPWAGWQQFPETIFDSVEAAYAGAFKAARKSVDLDHFAFVDSDSQNLDNGALRRMA
jgi:hypothetical protein